MADLTPDFSRRKFMAASLTAVASASLAGVSPALVRAQEAATGGDEPGEIAYRTLGRTGLKVPVVSFGGGACNDPSLVQSAYESGMRLFDTAASYGYGRNEQMIGKAIHQMGVRDKVILQTKAHTPAQRNGLTPEQSKATLRKTLEGSLKRLKTDYVDILYIHDVRDTDAVNNQAIQEAASELKKEGKARFIGIATHASMAAVINAAVAAEIYDVVLTSFNFTMANDPDMDAAIANAGAKGVGMVAMKTQAGGGRFPNPDTLREYDGATINNAALKWVLGNDNFATSIPGIGNFDHLRANIAVAANLPLSDTESKFLSDNSIVLGMGFCRQCSKCLASCPEGVDIPNLMRTHMYAAQYANFELARKTIDGIESNRTLTQCTTCSACVAECANTVDIPRKIGDLKLIYA